MKLELTTDEPVYIAPRSMSPEERKACEEYIEKSLKDDVIEKISENGSAYSSPMFLVYEGKAHRPWRCVIDYKGLNSVTRKELENLESILLGMKDVEVMTTIDLKAGFHQIPVAEEDRLFDNMRPMAI